MAWETRNGNRYYYQSVREDGEVRKVYVGRGELAELLAHAAETRARVRASRAADERAELACLEDLAAPLRELDKGAETLARAVLVAAGYRRHKGEWRMKRDA